MNAGPIEVPRGLDGVAIKRGWARELAERSGTRTLYDIAEQRANNRIIHPSSRYAGPAPRAYARIGDRA